MGESFYRITILFSICFGGIQKISAQWNHAQIYENIDKSIGSINRLLGSDCKMEYKEELIITFYDNGVPYRVDRVFIDALDRNNVHYVAEEKSVAVHCIEFKGLEGGWKKRYGKGCIGRELSREKKKATYSRIAFPVKDEETAKNLQMELENLIMFGNELTFK